MRILSATSLLPLVVSFALRTNGFHVASNPAGTRTSTSLAARRSLFPVLRRSDIFFPDIDRMFEEMQEFDNSLATAFPRPGLSLLGRDMPKELASSSLSGIEVTQDENSYKVAFHAPDMEEKDIDLQLDNDGRTLRLKGDRKYNDGGMTVHSRFEKAILLSPDVDTTNLVANMSGGTITVVAPKIELKAPENALSKKIEIKVVEPEAALGEDNVEHSVNMQETQQSEV
jgi:HSP20 family molecular chaperone IbpA